MKKILNLLAFSSKKKTDADPKGKRPTKKDFNNAEVTPGQLFEHYREILIRPEEIFPKTK